jgi:hypothetical protein
VQLLGKTPTDNGSEDRIGLDLAATPADVERIVLAASRYGKARFGDLEDLRLTLADRGGEELLGFSVEGFGDMRAVIFAELYRRDGGWKFRAIGQGYDSGLAGLATDFGIDVDDADDAEESGESGESADDEQAEQADRTEEDSTAAVSVPAAPAVAVAPKRPRTARKKVTLPAVARKSLASVVMALERRSPAPHKAAPAATPGVSA